MFSDKTDDTDQPWKHNLNFSDSSNIFCFKGNNDLELRPGGNDSWKKNLKSKKSCQTLFTSGQFVGCVHDIAKSKWIMQTAGNMKYFSRETLFH